MKLLTRSIACAALAGTVMSHSAETTAAAAEYPTKALRILGIWWEAGFNPRQAKGFVPAMREALRAYKRFVGAETLEWLPAASTAGRLFGTLKRS